MKTRVCLIYFCMIVIQRDGVPSKLRHNVPQKTCFYEYVSLFYHFFFVLHYQTVSYGPVFLPEISPWKNGKTEHYSGKIKVRLSQSFFFNDSASKMRKNTFHFILKALFVLKIFKFLP